MASRSRASLLEIDMDPLPMALLIDVGPGVGDVVEKFTGTPPPGVPGATPPPRSIIVGVLSLGRAMALPPRVDGAASVPSPMRQRRRALLCYNARGPCWSISVTLCGQRGVGHASTYSRRRARHRVS